MSTFTSPLSKYKNYLNKKVSVISTSKIRYEGILHKITENENQQELIINNALFLGTENRETEKPVPARKDIYEYLKFTPEQIMQITLVNDNQFVQPGFNQPGFNPPPMMYPFFNPQMMYGGYPPYWFFGNQMPPNQMWPNFNPQMTNEFGNDGTLTDPNFDFNQGFDMKQKNMTQMNFLENPNFSFTNPNTDRTNEKLTSNKDVNNENLKNLEEPNENKHEKKRNQFNEKHTNTDNNEKPKQEKTNLNNENTNKEKNKETEKTYDTNQDKSERYREKEKNYEKRKENYTEEYNNDGENRREDNRRYHQQGYRNNQRGNKYRGGNNYVQKGRGGGNRSKYQDFDLFESTKQFEKEKEMAKIEEQVKGMKVEGNISSNEDPEKAYDPEVSLFDTLSCETFERLKKQANQQKRKK